MNRTPDQEYVAQAMLRADQAAVMFLPKGFIELLTDALDLPAIRRHAIAEAGRRPPLDRQPELISVVRSIIDQCWRDGYLSLGVSSFIQLWRALERLDSMKDSHA